MFEKFETLGAADFRTRYQGTYGFFRQPAKAPMLVRLDQIDGLVYFKDKRGIGYELKPDVKDDTTGFEFLPPKSGFFNTDTGAFYVERTAARQFQRGVSERNTKMYRMAGTAGTPGGYQQVSINFKNLEQVYDNKMDKQLALKMYVEKLAPSFAISQEFAIDDKSVYVFGVRCGTVAEVTNEKLTFKLDDPSLFRTEINDALKSITKVEFKQ